MRLVKVKRMHIYIYIYILRICHRVFNAKALVHTKFTVLEVKSVRLIWVGLINLLKPSGYFT
jgi:hypothetical protein